MQSSHVSTAVIMAAGLGLRINRHIDEKPKGFIEIGGVALIERSIRIMRKHHIRRFIIGTGYRSVYYERLAAKYPGIELKKNSIYDQTNSFYTLFNLRELIGEDFLLLESDLLFEERAIRYLQQNSGKDIVLASGWTHSRDEVYIEADSRNVLVKMSKDKNELGQISGELVGITKLSFEAFQKICAHYRTDEALAQKIDYETALTTISQQHPIRVDKIEDLIWTEIDMESHLNRAKDVIYPRLAIKKR